MRKYLGLLLFIILIFPACQEAEIQPYSLDDTYNCFQDQSWTTDKVDAAIIGNWDWVYYSCFSGERREPKMGEMMLKIKEDHQLEVYQDGLLERTGSWEVVPRGSENFTLQTSQAIPWLRGDIVICSNVLLFFESYIDGCDNYFERL